MLNSWVTNLVFGVTLVIILYTRANYKSAFYYQTYQFVFFCI